MDYLIVAHSPAAGKVHPKRLYAHLRYCLAETLGICDNGLSQACEVSTMERELELLYDQEADVLYVSQGRPEYTDYVEIDEDVILRLDPETREIVGFTIIDFAAHFAQREPALSLPLNVMFRPKDEIKRVVAA
jgi:uncharacterized protein YuzE